MSFGSGNREATRDLGDDGLGGEVGVGTSQPSVKQLGQELGTEAVEKSLFFLSLAFRFLPAGSKAERASQPTFRPGRRPPRHEGGGGGDRGGGARGGP